MLGFLVLGVAVAAVAWWTAHVHTLIAAVIAAFFAGGALLAADAWQRAWRPPLRVWFEASARDERAQAAREGRRVPEDDEAFAIVEGSLRDDAAQTDSGVSLSVKVDAIVGRVGRVDDELGQARQAAAGGIIVTVVGSLAAERMNDWRAGRRVRLPVQLHRPSRYLNPGVPDNERALARRGTTLVGSVKSGALVEVIGRAAWPSEGLGAARAFARRAIRESVARWNGRSGAIVAAIVIGERTGLDADVQRRLQEAGTYHVIAISGGNIAILAGLLLAAFRLTGRLGRTAMLASIAALLAYARLVGGGASVDRATLMAVVYFGGRAIDHRGSPLNALAVVAGLLVAVDPLAVVDPAFLLTFGATLAILVFVPVATRIVDGSHRGLAATRAARSMLAASVATEALLVPIGALMFSRITFAGLGLNFVAIPLMGLAQIAGMAAVPIALLSSHAAAAAGFIAHLGAAGLVASADLVRFAPGLSYRVAQPRMAVVLAYYAASATAWTMWRRRATTSGTGEGSVARATRRWATMAAAGAAFWLLVDPFSRVAASGDGRLHITVLDVGQGDSIFVFFPRGSTLLVDAGGLSAASTFDIGDRVVAPVVRDAGFRHIDYLALTHGDPDHVGGASSIIREFRPSEVWEGIPVPRDETLTRLRMAAQAAGARWANVHAGDRIAIDGVEVVARHPRPADWERQKVRNDDSIVLELRWRDASIVLTGDIGRAVERELASAFPPARLRMVKIPHHGSLTSSTADFVRALHPQVAIVSAGRTNHFGHPVREVLERYRAEGAEVFRTDRDGAVSVDTDGYMLDVHGFAGRHAAIPQ